MSPEEKARKLGLKMLECYSFLEDVTRIIYLRMDRLNELNQEEFGITMEITEGQFRFKTSEEESLVIYERDGVKGSFPLKYIAMHVEEFEEFYQLNKNRKLENLH